MPPAPGSVVLTFRYGHEAADPTPEDLAAAATEVYTETLPDMSEADYEEHPNAWLRYVAGRDGPEYVIDAYRNGMVVLSKYADTGMNEVIAEYELPDVTRGRLLALWTWLAAGDVERIRAEVPGSGW